jgi:hypothetical protein
MFEIRHMHQLDDVCHFVMGLSTWANRKFEENWPASLFEAIMKVEGFSDVGQGKKSQFLKKNKFLHKKACQEDEWNQGQNITRREKPNQFQGLSFKPKRSFVKKGVPLKGN